MAVTLIPEDGTGITGANSYVSLADAITYSTNWANTAFTGAATDDIRTTALFTAAYALDRLYGRRYISMQPPYSTQGLLWPRYTAMGNDYRLISANSIPQCLKDAQCELANMSIAGVSLFPNQSTNRLMKETSVTVG